MTETLDVATTLPGRTRITRRALSALVAAVATETLGVDDGDVGVTLGDDRGLLTITLDACLPVVPLRSMMRNSSLLEIAGGSLLDRATRAEAAIAHRVASLTGLRVGHITMRIVGTRPQHDRRVR